MTGEDLEPRVRDVLAEACRRDVSSLGADDDLIEALGLDSLQGLQVLALMEKRFSVRFPDHRLAELRTIRGLASAIADVRDGRAP